MKKNIILLLDAVRTGIAIWLNGVNPLLWFARLFPSKFVVLCPMLLFFNYIVSAQGPIPFTIKNNSEFSESDLYVAIVGIDYTTDNHVWVNPTNGAVLPMSSSYNTVTGPTYGGNKGPGQNSLYANCFTRLSDIPDKTFTLPMIAGCRVYIAQGKQLYFYFFGANGTPRGYTSPNPQDPTDPNQGILYEIIELTNNAGGFFGNPTRVDAYKYPIGLELYGNGYYKRVGDEKSRAEIIASFKSNVPIEFQGCLNEATGEISAPSKTSAFADGSNGGTPGPYANYLKSYIDAIWEKYKTEDLIFFAGDIGVFKGRVIGEQLRMVGQSGGFAGRIGRVERRPTTQEALEGKGVLDKPISDGVVDLAIQAQLTAAINRHVVNTTTPNPGQQNWYDASKFYQTSPMNYYARFWHLPGISIDQLSYGFAYDDVADQSPSLHSPSPTKVIATFGGYATQSNPSGLCSGSAANGDYAYQISTSGNNVNWTFTPLSPIAGSTMAILYVKVNNGGYAGYTMAASGSNFVYTLPMQPNQILSFYFTYRVGNTLVERNSSQNPHAYTVGFTCTAARMTAPLVDKPTMAESHAVDLFPNPVYHELTVPGLKGKAVEIISSNGVRLFGSFALDNTINVSNLSPGIYTLVFMQGSEKVVKKFVKH